MSLFWEIHSGLPQEGPGSAASTGRALALVPDLASRRRILDVGCGPGRQTLDLAQATAGQIVAVDSHQPFLDELARRAAAAGLADRIVARNASMRDLPFADGSFDLIWSEGAIYNMGFGEGLAAWRRLLAPGGVVAVSELSWLVAEPPAEPRDFWAAGYPGMKSTARNLELAAAAGYRPLGHFTLPTEDWTERYYAPIAVRLAELRAKYAGQPEALAVLEAEATEIAIYDRWHETYGYVFYVMARTD